MCKYSYIIQCGSRLIPSVREPYSFLPPFRSRSIAAYLSWKYIIVQSPVFTGLTALTAACFLYSDRPDNSDVPACQAGTLRNRAYRAGLPVTNAGTASWCSVPLMGPGIQGAQRGGLETRALALVPGAIQHFCFRWSAKHRKAAA